MQGKGGSGVAEAHATTRLRRIRRVLPAACAVGRREVPAFACALASGLLIDSSPSLESSSSPLLEPSSPLVSLSPSRIFLFLCLPEENIGRHRHSAPARQCARAQPHRCSSRRPHAAPTTPRLTSARPRHPIWTLAKHEPDVSAAWQPTARRCRRVSSLASRPTLPMTTQVPRTAARRPPWPEAWTLSNAIGGPVGRNTEQTADAPAPAPAYTEKSKAVGHSSHSCVLILVTNDPETGNLL